MGSVCAFLLFMLLPGGHRSACTRRDSQALQSGCGVQRGVMVHCRPTYCQYIPSCFEEQTRGAEFRLA